MSRSYNPEDYEYRKDVEKTEDGQVVLPNGRVVKDIEVEKKRRALIKEDLQELRERLQHMEKIAETVRKVEASEGNKSASKKLKSLEDKLGSREHTIADAIGGNTSVEPEIDNEMLEELASDLDDLDQELAEAIGEMVTHEAEAVRKDLSEIVEAVEFNKGEME